jgi:hypothetical protein
MNHFQVYIKTVIQVAFQQLTKDQLSELPNLSTAEDISFSEKPISNNRSVFSIIPKSFSLLICDHMVEKLDA